MSLGDSIRKNSLWLLVGTLGSRVMTFVIGVVLARLLVPEDFGLLVTIQVFTGVLGYLASGGLGEAMIQAKHLRQRDSKVIFTAQLLVCILIYVSLFLFAPVLADWFNEPIYTDLLRVSAISFLLRPFAGTPNALLRRAMRFKHVALIPFAGMLVSSTTSILLAYNGYGVWSLIAGGLVGPLVSIPTYWWVCRWLPAIAFDREVLGRLGGFGIRIVVNEIILYLRTQTSNLLISHQLGPARVGLFNKSDSLAEMPTLVLSGAAYQTMFRALSSLQDNQDRSIYIFYRSITIVSLYAFPLYVGLLWLGEHFIVALYGEKWRAAGIPLQILAIAGPFRIMANLSGAIAAARNRLGTEIRIQIETWVVLIVGAVVGLQWGIIGVAVGLLPSLVYLGVRQYSLAASILGVGWRELWVALYPVVRMNGVMFIALLATNQVLTQVTPHPSDALYLVIMTAVGVSAYLCLLLFYPCEQLRTEAERWRTKLSLVFSRTKPS